MTTDKLICVYQIINFYELNGNEVEMPSGIVFESREEAEQSVTSSPLWTRTIVRTIPFIPATQITREHPHPVGVDCETGCPNSGYEADPSYA